MTWPEYTIFKIIHIYTRTIPVAWKYIFMSRLRAFTDDDLFAEPALASSVGIVRHKAVM